MAGGSEAIGPGRTSVLSAVGAGLIHMTVLPANPSCTSLPSPPPSVKHELPAAVGFDSHSTIHTAVGFDSPPARKAAPAATIQNDTDQDDMRYGTIS